MNKKQKVRLLQILKNLERNHQEVKNTILEELGLDDGNFWDIVDNLRDDLIDAGGLEECGCCGQYHRVQFAGDCRHDDERF